MSSAFPSPVPGTASVRSLNDQGPSSLSDYGTALLRRWWLVLFGLVLGAAAAAGYLSVVAKTYTSTATVQVTDTGVNDSAIPAASRNTTSNVDMDTEAQVVTSNTVATLARQQLKTDQSPGHLANKVKVTVPPNSAVLSIAFHASNARDAAAGAQAFAASYLANRAGVAQALVASELKSLQDRLPALNAQLQDVTGQTAVLPIGSPQRAYALAQQDVVHAQIDTINAAINPLLQQRITPGRLLSPATLPSAASAPQIPLVVSSGILGGLLVGAVLALIAVGRDRRISRSSEFVNGIGLPLLAVLPSAGIKTPGLLNAESAGAAAVRELRDRLVGNGVERAVLVVPLSASAGGSVVAVNLAGSLSADGSSCALVCASPDSLSPRRLRLPAGAGLSDALTYGFADVRSTIVHLEDHRFGVLLPGKEPTALLDRLHGTAMRDLVRDLRESYDHVVIEAPVWSSTRSALVLGRAAEAAILVAEARLTTREELAEAAEMLTVSGATVLGVVLVPHIRGTGLSGDPAHGGRHAVSGAAPAPETEGASVVAGSAGSAPNVR